MHKVYFVGCGPGDPDLVTIKAKKLMQKAQTIVYSGSLIPPKTLKMCKGEMHDASGMVREEITKLLSDSALAGKTTIRLHDGDPSIYGAIREQNAEKTQTVTNQASRFFFGLTLAFLYPWLNSLSYNLENSYCFGSIASPIIMIAVRVIFAFFTFDAIVCKVPWIIF